MAAVEATSEGAEAEPDKETTGNQDAEKPAEPAEEEPSSSTGAWG